MNRTREVAVGVVQLDVELGDQQATTDKVCSWADKAGEAGVDIVIFPELILAAGYSLGDGFYDKAETVEGPHVRQVGDKAREHGMYIVIGFAESSPAGAVYNSAAILGRDGEPVGVYRKTHIFTPTESFFALGSALRTFDLDFGRVAIPICYDLEFPESARLLCLQGAELLLTMTAHWVGSGSVGTTENFVRTIYSARALENRVPIAMCNRVGFDPGLGDTFFGLSRIVDADGMVITSIPHDGEDMITATLDLNEQRHKRQSYNYFRDRRPLLYGPLAEEV